MYVDYRHDLKRRIEGKQHLKLGRHCACETEQDFAWLIAVWVLHIISISWWVTEIVDDSSESLTER